MAKKKGFNIEIDRSDIISIIALIMSLGTIFITMKQTGIMKEQQEIMASQQKASVWPNLYVGHSQMTNSKESVLKGILINKGIGPAKITVMKVSIDGVTITNYDQFNALIKNKYERDSVKVSTSYGDYSGVVVSSEETTEFISVKIVTLNGDQIDLDNLDIKTEICYCSILDECWTIYSDDPRNQKDGCHID